MRMWKLKIRDEKTSTDSHFWLVYQNFCHSLLILLMENKLFADGLRQKLSAHVFLVRMRVCDTHCVYIGRATNKSLSSIHSKIYCSLWEKSKNKFIEHIIWKCVNHWNEQNWTEQNRIDYATSKYNGNNPYWPKWKQTNRPTNNNVNAR